MTVKTFALDIRAGLAASTLSLKRLIAFSNVVTSTIVPRTETLSLAALMTLPPDRGSPPCGSHNCPRCSARESGHGRPGPCSRVCLDQGADWPTLQHRPRNHQARSVNRYVGLQRWRAARANGRPLRVAKTAWPPVRRPRTFPT